MAVLLASALALAWLPRLNPLTTPWLAAKIARLLLYIALGMLALRPAQPVGAPAAAWGAALLVFGWIASVALSKDPLGVLRFVAAGA